MEISSSMIVCMVSLLVIIGMESTIALTDVEWENYKSQYGKRYKTKLEDTIRRELLVDTLDEIKKFNEEQAPIVGYKIGLNRFSDMTKSEIKRLGGTKTSVSKNGRFADEQLNMILASSNYETIPSRVDWRLKPNRVTKVKDQGMSCRSSWAFATTGLLEGQMSQQRLMQQRQQKRGQLPELSEQNLIDCVAANAGCRSGSIESALGYVQKRGIQLSSNYSFLGSTSECKLSPLPTTDDRQAPAIIAKAFALLPQNDEKVLRRVLTKFGPVGAVIRLDLNLARYKSGIYKEQAPTDCSKVNHGVLIVGFGQDSLVGHYWIVKNSWGQRWGEEGYLRLASNSSGIACNPIIAIV